MTKLAEILTGPETWCQNVWHTSRGEYCLLGALEALVSGVRPKVWSRECRRMAWVIGLPWCGDVQGIAGIIEWNNAPGRTWEEIQTVRDDYDLDRLLNP